MTEPENPLPSLLNELRRILEQERQTLMTGNPEGINAITQRKLALAKEIEAAWSAGPRPAPSTQLMTWLARYNQENAVICTAMLRHLSAALDRLRLHEPHRSYGPDGNEHTIPSPQVLGAA